MSNKDFEQPDAAPEAVNTGSFIDNPISREIFYKSGKAQVPGTKGKISPEDLGIKFSYREGEYEEGVKASYASLPAFTVYVLGVYSRFAGQEYNEAKPGESVNYTSTLYRDPKDPLFFRMKGVKDIRSDARYNGYWKAGNYHDVRAFADAQAYKTQVGYKKVMVCYCLELQCVVEIQVNRKIEFGMAEAIAKSTNTPRDPRRIGGLCDLSTVFWGFRFTGDFIEVDEIKGKPCENFTGKREWVFAPVFQCGVKKANGNDPELFTLMAEKQAEVDAYVDNQVDWAKSIVAGYNVQGIDDEGYRSKQAVSDSAEFPTVEVGAIEDDQLPF
jgi:hypothetical protein